MVELILQERLRDFSAALATLTAIADEPESEIVRDASIKRFEFTFDLCWKTARDFLFKYGVEANSPRNVFRELRTVDILNDDEVVLALEMVNGRNLSAHTYKRAMAEKLFDELPSYRQLMTTIHDRITTSCASSSVD